jgi:hypothetical protein
MLPCILHLEMRCGIKFLSMILSEELSRPENRNAQDEFVIEIETLMDRKVFGTHLAPSQWFFPVKEKELECETHHLALGEVRFTNPRVCAVMSSIDLIIDACVDDEDEDDHPANVKVAMKHYCEGVEMLRLKSEYIEHDLREKNKSNETMDDKTDVRTEYVQQGRAGRFQATFRLLLQTEDNVIWQGWMYKLYPQPGHWAHFLFHE